MTHGKTIRVRDLATARSGDKGNHANIGVAASDENAYAILVSRLTAVRVQDWFQELGVTRVERYELPKVLALNFVLYDALGGGASRSLRIDTQGKLLATSLLDLTFHANAWEENDQEPRTQNQEPNKSAIRNPKSEIQ
jgi:hypothetical protein